MRTALKILLVLLIFLLSFILITFASFFLITAGSNLQEEKLIDYGKTIAVYDDANNKIESASLQTKQTSVRLEELSTETVNAFIASEDRNFYKHNGLNYKRMLKALYKNISSHSFKEGASTISQQLIKNTHLSSDKTITRKLKEIKLTKQLERRYSKDDILEMYLNTIYFGHNCYGLEAASQFYFDKRAGELTLDESATVVGLLASPNNYSPFKNAEKCLKKRNIVLNSMWECKFISKEQCDNAKKQPLPTQKQSKSSSAESYLYGVFNEFEELNLENYAHSGNIQIKTYMNKKIQTALDNIKTETDFSYFVRTAQGGIAGFASTIGNTKRQIGSTAKPLFVYAPAIEEKKLNLFTKIKDEPIDYGGYTPENYDKKYHGNVTVEESIAKSYNIPAVKTMNSLNLDKIENYSKKMNVNLEDADKNLSLALGCMKEGMTLKQLSDCYSTFQGSGIYTESHYIREICDSKGKILYTDKTEKSSVFSQGTCSLINQALIQTVKTGTAKKLKDISFDVACKTGTCGNKDGNTDAYAVGYTSNHVFGIWLGDKDNARLDITGGTDCCEILKQIIHETYTSESCPPLDINSGTTQIEIDREEYENNDKIILCDDTSPKLNRLTVKCLSDNLPKEKSTRFSSPKITKPNIIVNNNKISISLCQTKYYSYLIKRYKNVNSDIIYDGVWKNEIYDEPEDGEYRYSVTPYFISGDNKYLGEEVFLPQVIINNKSAKDEIPDIVYKDWYNQ